MSQASNTRVGIGAYFQRSETVPDTLEVKRILPNSPAAACKLVSVGDAIVAVDGELVGGKSLSQLAEKVRESVCERERERVCVCVCVCMCMCVCARARAFKRDIFGLYAQGAGYAKFHSGVLISEKGNFRTLQRDFGSWCQRIVTEGRRIKSYARILQVEK